MEQEELRTIAVGRARVGMIGLRAIFEGLAAAGRPPSEGLAKELTALAAKRNYIPAQAETEYGAALLAEYRRHLGEQVPEEPAGLSIKILGPGCQRCRTLASNVMAAVAALGVEADVEHIHEPARIQPYGIFMTPGLVVNGKVEAAGRVLTVEQIAALLRAKQPG